MNNSSKTILIVDDRTNWRNLLKTIFTASEREYSVQTASDIAEADKLLSQNQFGLVITNLGLEPAGGSFDRSGLKVVDKLQEKSPGTPCIIFTAFDASIREQIENYCTRYKAPVWVMWKWDASIYKDITEKVDAVFNRQPGRHPS
jgi:DNA-binding NtrC family response regulator